MTPFMRVGCTDFFLIPVSLVYKWDPAKLSLAAPCWRWVPEKGPHEKATLFMHSGYYVALLGCWCVKQEVGAQLHLVVCAQLHPQVCLIVGTNLFLLWLNSKAPSCHRPFNRNIESDHPLLVPLLAGSGRCPPEYGNNDVNQSGGVHAYTNKLLAITQ
jgi:hypothetical protein